MANRIDRKFTELRRKKKKALIVFFTGGDPSLKKNESLLPELERAGADLIEIGVPFSDPLADGPVIQASSQRALARKTTLDKILRMVRAARKKCGVPIVLMGYLNPFLRYGLARFAKKARASGVDGVIIPDLPPEEGRQAGRVFSRAGLDLIYLLAPTSSPDRQRRISRASRGFIYFVSVTGVTGARRSFPKETLRLIRHLKRTVKRPVCVGFGVSTPGQARAVSRSADGVIVGSVVVKALAAHPGLGAAAFAKKFIRPLANAIGKRV